jgi:hypothetical protein
MDPPPGEYLARLGNRSRQFASHISRGPAAAAVAELAIEEAERETVALPGDLGSG